MKSINLPRGCTRLLHALAGRQYRRRLYSSKLRLIPLAVLGSCLHFNTQKLAAAPVCSAHTAGAPCTTSPDPGTSSRRHQSQTLLANLVESTSGNVFVAQTDYQHPQTRLRYTRYYNSLLASQQGASGLGWQNTYSVKLKKFSSHALLLLQADGRQSVFRQRNANTVFHADRPHEGTIEREGRYLKWNIEKGSTILFLGSFPVRYDFPDNSSLDLFYRDGQLKNVTDNLGNRIELSYSHRHPAQLQSITLPQAEKLQYTYSNGHLSSVSRQNNTIYQYSYEEVDRNLQISSLSEPGLPRHRQIHYADNAKPVQLKDSAGRKTITFKWPGATLPLNHDAANPNSGINTISSGINSVDISSRKRGETQLDNYRDKRILRSLLLPESGHCANNSAGSGSTNSLLTAIDSQEETGQQECEQNNPEPSALPSATIPGAQYREVFAAGCLSYFDVYAGTGRGFRIEEAFMQHDDYANAQVTATRFPVLDFLDNRIAVAIVSRDLESPSYSAAAGESALYYKLLSDAAHMHAAFLQTVNASGQISATQGGLTTTVKNSDFDHFVFELVVQRGVATAAHSEQIQRAAAEIFRLYGIRLNVVEIP